MDIFDDDEPADVIGNVEASAFSSITDSIVDTQSGITVLSITITAEIGAIVMFIVARDKVVDALDNSDFDVWLYVGAAMFVVGFLNCFAIYRLAAKKWPHPGARAMNWAVSIIAGILNIGLFYALLTFRMR
jgi:hypothetical protein